MKELVFILDRSGSMIGRERDTIGGFNSMLAKQRKEKGDAVVNTVLFDGTCEVLHDRVPLEKVVELNEDTYFVRGSTALLDAVGGAIHHIGNIHKYARKEDVPEQTIFVIITDGMENASRRYTYEMIHRMIERQKTKYGWEFLFLGANIDAAKEAGRIGITPDRAVTYYCDASGIDATYDAVSCAVSMARQERPIAADWKEAVEKDNRRREKKK